MQLTRTPTRIPEKKRTSDIRPREKPDRKYLQNSDHRENLTLDIRHLEKSKPNIEEVVKKKQTQFFVD